jgi:hypothetical protein
MSIEAVMRAHLMILGFLLASRIAIGGALFVPELDRGLSNGGSQVPLVGSQSAYSYVSYADCGHSLLRGESWSVGPVIQDRLEGCKFADGCEFGEMADRRFSVDVGLGFSWETGLGSLSVSWVTNMLSAVQCEWFDSEIRDSPLVDRPYSASLLFGLLYTF